MEQTSEAARSFFRVPCELQIRYRVLEKEELETFQKFGMRPSPYTQLRMGLDSELGRLSLGDEAKSLLERAFQMLLNIDQRLERIEENLQGQLAGAPVIKESHEWVHADLSAGGVAFSPATPKTSKVGDNVLVDLILPSLPEQRVVATGKIVHTDGGKIGIEFALVHQDDREAIHRFVFEKERELLRARAIDRDQKKNP